MRGLYYRKLMRGGGFVKLLNSLQLQTTTLGSTSRPIVVRVVVKLSGKLYIVSAMGTVYLLVAD